MFEKKHAERGSHTLQVECSAEWIATEYSTNNTARRWLVKLGFSKVCILMALTGTILYHTGILFLEKLEDIIENQ